MPTKPKVIKINLAKEIKKKKIWIIVGIVAIGLLILFDVTKSSSRKNSVLNPIPMPSPTLKAGPSERALKASAWIYSNTSKVDMDATIKKNPSLGGNTPAQTVNNIAVYLDQNPANLALVEADMQKAGNIVANPVIPDTSGIENSINQSNQKLKNIQDCQDKMALYQTCVNDYTNKLADYTQCLSSGSRDISSPYYKYCYKPVNYCYKPFCN